MAGMQEGLARKVLENVSPYRAQLPVAQAKLATLQQQVSDTQRSIDGLTRTIARADTFEMMIGADYQCPKCWITKGIKSSLIQVHKDGQNASFNCGTCREAYFFYL